MPNRRRAALVVLWIEWLNLGFQRRPRRDRLNLGEELITIIPFLALLTFLTARCGLSRRVAIIGAWIGSAMLFGALHLSTYQWHLGQVLLIIGTARLVLTVPYLITKNIWSSTIAHITNDWLIFAVVLIGRLA